MNTRYFNTSLLRTILPALCCAGALSTQADTINWMGPGRTSADPANWSTGTVPGENDTVSITGSGFGGNIDVQAVGGAAITWTVQNWEYDTGTTLSVLGRGTANSTSILNITGTLSKQGDGVLAFRNQGATRLLDLEVNALVQEAGTLFLGSTSDSLTTLNVSSAEISGGVLSLRTAAGGTANLSTVSFTGDGTLDLHGTGAGETSVVTVGSLSSNGAMGTIKTTAGNTATLQIASAINTTSTYGGIITGATTSLEKKGAGTQVLSGANDYAGGTVINEGTLLVANTAGSATGSGAVAVNAGGRLGGAGFIGGPVTTAAGDASSHSVLAPGTESGGVLTVQNTLSLGDATRLEFRLTTPDVAGGTAGNSLIAVLGDSGSNGDLDLGANVVLSLSSLGTDLEAGTYDLITFTGSLTGEENLATWTVEGLSGSYTFGSDSNSVYLTVAAVPEPSTAMLVGGASVMVAFLRRRKR